MSKMNQKEAVFNTTLAALKEAGVEFKGDVNSVSKELRANIVSLVSTGICNGDVEFSDEAKKKYDTPEKVSSYAAALVSNHFRKDSRLNGGEKYAPKSSRTGDSQLKNLKLILKQYGDNPEKAAIITEAIAKRTTEIEAEKAAKQTAKIDMTALPSDIVALITK